MCFDYLIFFDISESYPDLFCLVFLPWVFVPPVGRFVNAGGAAALTRFPFPDQSFAFIIGQPATGASSGEPQLRHGAGGLCNGSYGFGLKEWYFLFHPANPSIYFNKYECLHQE